MIALDVAGTSGRHIRYDDVATIFRHVRRAACCAVVGVSNVGKSVLLRALADPAIQRRHLGTHADNVALVYVDCNRMVEMSERAFYEAVLSALLDQLPQLQVPQAILDALHSAYEAIINPPSDFHIPLRFNQALTLIVSRLSRTLVLAFDEFDEAFARLDERVFANLRALKDRDWTGIVYITATDRDLVDIRADADVEEFVELFSHQTHYLAPLNREEAHLVIQHLAQQMGVTFDDADERFILEWSGGHPGLLEAVARVLGEVTGPQVRDEVQDFLIHRRVAEQLRLDPNVHQECDRIWYDLTQAEKEALLTLLSPGPTPPTEALAALKRRHVILSEAEEDPRLFARAFAEYVERHRRRTTAPEKGIRYDPDAGVVYVDGRRVDDLTPLEHRLFLLLYGRLGQIVDKYTIVENVWGERYIDEVDDARIERLVSRLRKKLQPDKTTPTYLVTVRGRGYRLLSR